VVDHFARLLDFGPSDLQRCATDTDGRLVPLPRSVTTPVAIFIDGIDEYFNKHIEGGTASPSVTGELSPNVWYFAQLGLVEVAYQLRRIKEGGNGAGPVGPAVPPRILVSALRPPSLELARRVIAPTTGGNLAAIRCIGLRSYSPEAWPC
jgi:hypothetical protein